MGHVEKPQSFVVREECKKATWQNGFRRKLDESEGWAGFSSTTVPGTIHFAAAGGYTRCGQPRFFYLP